MTDRIRPLIESDVDAYVEIMAGAYPGLKIVSETDRQRMRDRLAATFADPSVKIYGLNEDGRILAGMILYDFTMNVRGTLLQAGGLGSLAVDLLYRRQKLAKEMVTFYLDHYRDRGVSLALLYPFRPDFYRRMGFGYGTKMNRYVIRSNGLRAPKTERSGIETLGSDDVDQVLACYNSYAETTHGMILSSRSRVQQMLSNPALRTIGYIEQGKVLGFMAFEFENHDHFLNNDLRIRLLIWRDSTALQGLLAFVRSLADQCQWAVFNTQDPSFHHLLDDPRDRTNELIPSVYHESNTQGVGLMYRVIDLRHVFNPDTGIRFGRQNLTLKITLEDSFMPANSRSIVVDFRNGWPTPLDAKEYEAEIRMGIGDFSSLVMGVITLEQLALYGLAHVSEASRLEQINDLFAIRTQPVCLTAF